MASYHLQIVTPDRMVFDGQVQSLIVRTVTGDACILAGHIDYAVALAIGQAKVVDDKGKTRTAACSGGMLSVSGGQARVMATTFEWSDEIDLARAEEAKRQAEERMQALRRGDQQFASAEAKLKRAIARIGAKK
ncbi:MAG: ATP synthase F1 subunit epsilon [Clostridiales bacterium]|nr:ATP synthase F1 subunit epsilon [Clostridiales bacterium]